MKNSRTSTKADLMISGKARLFLRSGRTASVRFNLTEEDGWLASYAHVFGKNEVLYNAWRQRRASLNILGTLVRVNVLGRSPLDGRLIVESKPLFRALNAARRVYPGKQLGSFC
jgi:hypothetical protein